MFVVAVFIVTITLSLALLTPCSHHFISGFTLYLQSLQDAKLSVHMCLFQLLLRGGIWPIKA